MIFFIFFFYALKDFFCFVNIRFFYLYNLEASFKGKVAFNVFCIFFCCSCTNNLDFSTRKSRLHDIRSIHCTFVSTSPDYCMKLINEKNNIFIFLKLVQDFLHSLFKLTTIFCTSNNCCKVERKNSFFKQFCRNFTCCNALGKSFYNSSLSYSRFAC